MADNTQTILNNCIEATNTANQAASSVNTVVNQTNEVLSQIIPIRNDLESSVSGSQVATEQATQATTKATQAANEAQDKATFAQDAGVGVNGVGAKMTEATNATLAATVVCQDVTQEAREVIDGINPKVNKLEQDSIAQSNKIVQLEQKKIPSQIPTLAKYLYAINGYPTDSGIVIVNTDASICSGVIDIKEGDVIDCVGAYSNVSLYKTGMTNRITIPYPATVPKDYKFAVIPYKHNNIGSGLDCVVTYIPYKITTASVDFIVNDIGKSENTVNTSFAYFVDQLKKTNVTIGKNKFDKNNTVVGVADASNILNPNNTSLKTARIIINAKQYTLSKIRTYNILDIDGNIVKGATISNTVANTIDIPTNGIILQCSAYIANDLDLAQVEEGGTATSYEPYSTDLEYNGKSMISDIRSLAESAIGARDVSKPISMELGTISSGSMIDSKNRMRGFFEVKNGITYTASTNSSEYSIIARFTENRSGVLVAYPTNTIVGSTDIVKFWVVVSKAGNPTLYPADCNNSVAKSVESLNNTESIDEIISEQKTVKSISLEDYKIQQLENSIEQKDKSLKLLNLNLKSILRLKTDTISDSANFNVPSNKKVVINLHRRANSNYDTYNDAYLPNAEKDFSDIRVKSNTGEYLPFYPIYKGNIDIIQDSSLPKESLIYADSSNILYGTKEGKIVKSTDSITWSKISVFEDLKAPVLAYIDDQNNMFVGAQGILYKSVAPYTIKNQVLDFNTYHPDTSVILSHSMVQHPNGTLIIGSYQIERDIIILKSENRGDTWNMSYRDSSGKYQHVHNMSIDVNQTPVAIYAGLDGGGGILKTVDSGANWIDLRELPSNDLKQSSDYGVIYSDTSGYRLIGGETSIVGGVSIQKTTNDLNYLTVLNAGKAVYFAQKSGNKLFAGGLSSKYFKTSEIFVSDDNGETWSTAFTTGLFTSTGASDGFRFVSKPKGLDHIIVGCQGRNELRYNSGLRIFEGGDNYYAQIVIDIPKDCTSITIESGYMCQNESSIEDDMYSSDYYYPLNNKLNLVKNEVVEFDTTTGGKRFASIQPPVFIGTGLDIIIKKGMFINDTVDLVNSEFTISFWGTFTKTSTVNLLRKGSDIISIFNGYQLKANNSVIGAFNAPVIDCDCKFDLVFTASKCLAYTNGQLAFDVTNTYSSIINKITGDIVILENITDNDIHISSLTIRKRAITAQESLDEYYLGLSNI